MKLTDGTDLCLHCGATKTINQLNQCLKMPCSAPNPVLVREKIADVVATYGEEAVSERCRELLK